MVISVQAIELCEVGELKGELVLPCDWTVSQNSRVEVQVKSQNLL